MIIKCIYTLSMIKRIKISSIFGHGKYYSTFSSDNQYEKLISLVKSCKQTSQTSQIHGLMLKSGLESVSFPLSKLLAQISLQDIHYAASVFKHIESPNLFMFNTMLRGYSISDDPSTALSFFNRMRIHTQTRDFVLDQFTFISLLKSCARSLASSYGFGVHTIVLKYGICLFLNVKNALLNFYCVCGRVQEAHQLFDELGEQRDLVSWNTLMGSYLSLSQYDLVLGLFRDLYIYGFTANVSSILNVLSAVREIRHVYLGKCLHGFCIKIGFLSNLNVISTLISMYGKVGHIHYARLIFDESDVKKDIVMWNCLMDGYSSNGLTEEALKLLKSMKHNNMQPNSSTLASLLSACSASGALATGQLVHDYIEELQLKLDVVLGTALVDMYAKSGFLGKAINVFDRMQCKDVRSWTAMISGYGLHGQASNAIMLFRKMENECNPNEVTFLVLLNSCSHTGLVIEGVSCFKRMVEVYGLKPKIQHYGCMIDLLGRNGLLEEAYELIKKLPIESDGTAWRALLGACKVYGNVNLAERVKHELELSHDEHPADELVVTSTYAVAGMVQDYKYMSDRERYMGNEMEYEQFGKKEAGWSSFEI